MKQRSSNQSGYILVLGIFVVMALLTIAMLAIDLGNIYIWRMRLERAAKAGVSAGLGFRTLKGWSFVYGGAPQYTGAGALVNPPSGTTNQLAALRAQMQIASDRTVRSNRTLPTSSIPVSTADYDLGQDLATVTVTMNIPTILLGRISPFGVPMRCNSPTDPALCELSVTQRAALNPATIVMLLDTSGSMECEAGNDNCSCRTNLITPCGTTDPINRPKLIRLLKTAVHEFHSFFNPVRDRIAIIPFNLGANRSFRLVSGGAPRPFGVDSLTYTTFKNVIGEASNDATGLIPFGNTNPCDAFIMAADEIRELRSNAALDGTTIRPQIVFFTDGAPNAMRGSFIQPDGTRLDNAKPNFLAPNDWYQYSIEWNNAGTLYRGPGPLIHQSFRMFNNTIGIDGLPAAGPTPPAPTPTPTPAPSPARCGVAWYEEPEFKMIGSLNKAESPPTSDPSRTRGCLTGLNFDIPGTGSNYGVRGVTFTNNDATPSSRTVQYTDQLPYYCTIEAADYIRQVLNGSVFTVGLGNPPSPAACYNHDPLQDSDNSFLRKDNFLARVALDTTKILTTSCAYQAKNNFEGIRDITIPASCTHRQTGKTFKVGYTHAGGSRSPDSFPPGTPGEYVGLDDPFRLSLAFAKIAKQILFRLND